MRSMQRAQVILPQKGGQEKLESYKFQRYADADRVHNAQRKLMGVKDRLSSSFSQEMSEEKKRSIKRLPTMKKLEMSAVQMKKRFDLI